MALFLFNERRGRLALDRSHNDRLVIPEIFRAQRRVFLQAPWQGTQWNLSTLQDLLVNVAGFVPFGMFTICGWCVA
jgi:hypothetical protein